MMAKLSPYVRPRVFLENHTGTNEKNRESLLQEGIKTSTVRFLCFFVVIERLGV